MPKISKKRAIRKNRSVFYVSRDVGVRCMFLSWEKPVKDETGVYGIPGVYGRHEMNQHFVLLPKQIMKLLPCLPAEGEYIECNINLECVIFDTEGNIKIG